MSLVALTHSLLLVNPSLPVKNVKELIAVAKAQPGKLNYASGTTGALHSGVKLLKMMAGVNIVQVPYKGTAAQLTALIANEVQMSFVNDAVSAAAYSWPDACACSLSAVATVEGVAHGTDRRRVGVARLRCRRVEWHSRAGAHAAGHNA